MHLDLDEPVALTGLAASTLDVEREAAGLIPAHPRVGRPGHERPDQGEDAGIRGGVGARGAPDRGLVDVDDLVEVLGALDAVVLAGALLGAVKHLGEGPVQDVVDQGGLARSRDARHRREGPQRDLDGHALEVVLARVVDDHVLAVGGPPRRRHGDLLDAREELAREGGGMRGDLARRAHGHDVSAQLPRPRTQVDHEVRRADRLLVVLDHEHRVAEVAQALEGVEQSRVVALVKPDAGLVEDVQDPHQARADLGGEPDPLPLAPRQRRGRTVEGEVLETDVGEKAQALPDLFEHATGDLRVPLREGQGVEELPRGLDGEAHDVRDGPPRDLDGQRLRPEARALARGAVAQGHVVLQLLPDLRGQRLLVAPLEDGHGALEAVARLAVQDDVAGLPGQLSPGGLEIELVAPGQDLERLLEGRAARARPRHQRAFLERAVGVRRHEGGIDLVARPDAAAIGAGPVGIVEGEHAG